MNMKSVVASKTQLQDPKHRCEFCVHWRSPIENSLGVLLGSCEVIQGVTNPLHTCSRFKKNPNEVPVENRICETCKWWVSVDHKLISSSGGQRREGDGPWGHCQYEPKPLWHESTYFCSKWTARP